MLAFAFLLISYDTSAQALSLLAPQANTIWQMQKPDPSRWITSSQPLTVQVRVTNTFGIVDGAGVCFFSNHVCVSQMSNITTKTAVLTATGLTLIQGTGNSITFTIATSDVAESIASMTYTLFLDSVPPTATFTTPVFSSVWVSGMDMLISWLPTEATSGLSTTQVWIKPPTPRNPFPITTTTSAQVNWIVTTSLTNTDEQEQVELRLLDNAGNTNTVWSPIITVKPVITHYVYLPLVMLCNSQIVDCYEPNNNYASAYPLAMGFKITSSINMSSDRYDYYQTIFGNTNPHTYTLKGLLPCPPSSVTCDLDLYLYSSAPGNPLVVKSDLTGSDEQIVFTPTTVITPYIVLVYAFNINTSFIPTTYTLELK